MTTMTRQIHAETLKLATLRTTWMVWILGLAGGLLLSAVQTDHDATLWLTQPDNRSDLPLAGVGFNGLMITQLAFAVLGALMITSETTTRSLTSTLTACPRRITLVAAKAITTAGLGLFAAAVTTGLTVLVTLAILHVRAVPAPSPAVAHLALQTTGYLLSNTVLGLGIGLLLQNTAAAFAVAFLVDFLLPILLQSGDALTSKLADALPGSTLMHLINATPSSPAATTSALAVLPLLLLLLGTVRLHRSDVM